MKSGSTMTETSGRRVALFLVACALVLRLPVPAGWMPVATARGVTLNWRSGVSHAVPAEAEAMLAAAMGDKAALLLATLSISGAVMWWRRRPQGLLGAPIPLSRPRYGPLLIGALVLLAAAMPLFGATLVLVAICDRLLLPRWPAARRWLGLVPIRA